MDLTSSGVDLSRFDNAWFSHGRGFAWRAAWFVFGTLIFENRLFVFSSMKSLALRFFGASVGKGVVIKPGVRIKYPWNISIGDNSWIGEDVWLDSLGEISIAGNVCVSQGAYLCTGNHDWADPDFGLIVKPIRLEDGSWVGARAVVGPGVTLARGSVLTAGSVLTQSSEPFVVCCGNPAVPVKGRTLRGAETPRAGSG